MQEEEQKVQGFRGETRFARVRKGRGQASTSGAQKTRQTEVGEVTGVGPTQVAKCPGLSVGNCLRVDSKCAHIVRLPSKYLCLDSESSAALNPGQRSSLSIVDSS